MSEHSGKEERDEVLFAFHQACERPTAEDIIAWTDRFPEFAEDIRAHAAIARDWVASEGLPAIELKEAMLARAYSNALNALFDAETKAARSVATGTAKNFYEMLNERGKEIYLLAREMDIARSVLADLFNGWMLAPVRRRLVEAVMSSFGITEAAFDNALTLALENPRFGHAKADSAPTVIPRPCDDIIRDSNMSNERKRYWLEED